MKVYTSTTTTTRSESDRTKVGIADYAVVSGDATLTTSGLGSCVGISLHDRESGVAGLAHAMLPYADGDATEAKYADTVVPALVRAMVEERADPNRMQAKLAGGSTMFEFSSADGSIGDRNVAAAKEALARQGIRVVAEDVGGNHGRSLELVASTGELRVRSAHVGETTL
ncbi:chemoreceptor glutamine deamidase CheD [Halogeometricum pallidum JCM 14848]|uniref:Probable chemoreceptor glutamine deamidase CheD n=1 Tax=Halogeometricum pallidum JCM 14848 TaxID=1227487 RepID=M0CUC2_HALPD|nr:chemoreceptor glutamine deamidase CheD [Halogeometricum pallidum]ELZ26248.1 chemoreceptor glutamine deamidase CheD [Halogeometricum pallidum JCM 14848]